MRSLLLPILPPDIIQQLIEILMVPLQHLPLLLTIKYLCIRRSPLPRILNMDHLIIQHMMVSVEIFVQFHILPHLRDKNLKLLMEPFLEIRYGRFEVLVLLFEAHVLVAELSHGAVPDIELQLQLILDLNML